LQLEQVCFSSPVLKKLLTADSQSGHCISFRGWYATKDLPVVPTVTGEFTQTVLHLSHITVDSGNPEVGD
jgi:hypothetical protein